MHCIQLEYTTIQHPSVLSDIYKGSYGYEIQNLKKTKFVNFMFYVKNWNVSLQILKLYWNVS